MPKGIQLDYDFAEDVRELAKVVIQEDSASGKNSIQYIDTDQLIFIRAAGKKKPRNVATMATVRSPYDMITNKIYLFTVFAEAYDHLDDNKKKIVVKHELMHCDYEFNGKLRRHDIEDFKEIIEEHGMEWLEEGRKA